MLEQIHRSTKESAVAAFVAYSISGFVGFSIDLTLLWLLLAKAHLHYAPAVFLGYLLGVTIHFAGCRFLIFASTERTLSGAYSRFVLVALLGAFSITGIVAALIEIFAVQPFPARVAAAATVGIIGFFTHKRISFGLR